MEKFSRYDFNKRILAALKVFLAKNQDLRFIQALWALGIVNKEDRFYEESEETWEKLETYNREVPKTSEDCLDMILEICNKAIDIYDKEEFYEDDCDRFLGESLMAQEVQELIKVYQNAREERK